MILQVYITVEIYDGMNNVWVATYILFNVPVMYFSLQSELDMGRLVAYSSVLKKNEQLVYISNKIS
jgi:hypothetical protein